MTRFSGEMPVAAAVDEVDMHQAVALHESPYLLRICRVRAGKGASRIRSSSAVIRWSPGCRSSSSVMSAQPAGSVPVLPWLPASVRPGTAAGDVDQHDGESDIRAGPAELAWGPSAPCRSADDTIQASPY